MIAFPNAKINLGLTVIAKRADGFHDLETVFYPAPLRDMLEVVTGFPQQSSPSGNVVPGVNFSCSGLKIDGDPASNLCIKAYELLAADFPEILPVQLHLHKVIPMGAGLGGGSADGAFTLKLLNELFQLDLSQQHLIDYAARLGSDCPFFIINKPCLGSSRGEVLEEIPLDLNQFDFVLVEPGIHVDTGWAFSQIIPGKPAAKLTLREIMQLDPSLWKNELVNNFEVTVFEAHPILRAIKSALYDAGAVYASMSGSGSSMFGLFPRSSVLPEGFLNSYLVHHIPASR